MSSLSFIFESVLVTSLLVAALVKVAVWLALRVGLLDMPQSEPHKRHATPTPLAGGIIMVVALLLSGWFYKIYRSPEVFATLWGGLIIFAFGLWDDFKVISPWLKFLGQFAAVFILIRMGISIGIFESPEFFLRWSNPLAVYLNWALTAMWVVGITNAINFVDSMDGLAVGLGGMAAAFFMLVTLDSRQPILSLHSSLILGVCIGLYFFNSSPALLFLGDSGAQTLGFILAVLAIAYQPRGANQSSSWFVPILLLGVPIFDTALVVISRIRRKRPIYTAALDHTYHRLLAFGWSSSRAVLTMQVFALLLGCLAFVLLNQPPLVANVVFIAVVVAGGLTLSFLDDRKIWSNQEPGS